jgi:hypothetical protein
VPPALGPTKYQAFFAGPLEFDEGSDVDEFRGGECPARESLELGEGLLGFCGLPGLAPGEVRGLKSPGVVFVFRLALFVGRLELGGARGPEVEFRVVDELGDDEVQDFLFVHGREMGQPMVAKSGWVTSLGSCRGPLGWCAGFREGLDRWGSTRGVDRIDLGGLG